MKIVTVVMMAALAIGCGSGGIDPVPCYDGPTPEGALVWECLIQRCDFGCDVGEGWGELVAAPSEAAARTCLQDVLASGDPSTTWRVTCVQVGVWSSSPGGAPNAHEDGAP